jgi:segregation and condensation protein B
MSDLSSAIEAILFASGEAFSINRISLILGVEIKDVELAAAFLQNEYERNKRGIRILRLDDKLQMCSSPEYAQIIGLAMEQRKPPMLSQSALETLAIVAYFQPVTRAYIDQVRGVDSSYTVSSLTEKGLIEICGKLDVPGRPSVFKTTDVFLRTMGISSLDELPELPDISSNEGVDKLKSEIERLRSEEYRQIAISDISYISENKCEE